MIRTDCYLAVMKKFKEQNPNAHFEVITRKVNHILSPSWQFLQKYKEEGLSWKQYTEIFLHEMSAQGIEVKLRELKSLAEEKDVFLVCYEKDASKCHRSIVKQLIEGLDL